MAAPKFKFNVPFESFDEPGKFEPIKVPDLKPYLDQNRAVEQQDLRSHMETGAANLRLEQNRDNGILAYNKVVENFLQQENLQKVQHISKAANKIVTEGYRIHDENQKKNAMAFFNEQYMAGNIPTLEAVEKYKAAWKRGEDTDDFMNSIAGDMYASGEVDIDNVRRMLSLSAWQGPYKMQLLLNHYAKEIPSWMSNNDVELDIPPELGGVPGKKYSLQADNFEPGFAAQQKAYLEKQANAQLFGLFKDFPPEAVALTITPALQKFREDGDIDWSDKQTTRIEAELKEDFNDRMLGGLANPTRGSTKDAFLKAIKYDADFSKDWKASTDHAWVKLAEFAKTGQMTRAQYEEFLDSSFIPKGHKKPTTIRQFFKNKIAEHDIEQEIHDFVKQKEATRTEQREILVDRAVSDWADIAVKTMEETGAPPSQEMLKNHIRKLDEATGQSNYSEFSGYLTAENFNDEFVKDTLKHIAVIQGGKLTNSDLKGTSTSVKLWAMQQGLVAKDGMSPNADMVKDGKRSIKRFIQEYVPTQGAWDEGILFDRTQRRAEKDYLTIYQNNLNKGLDHYDADLNALNIVEKRIKDKVYSAEEYVPKNANHTYLQGLKEQLHNKGDYSIPIKAISKDMESLITHYEKHGTIPWPPPHNIRQQAKHAKVSLMDFIVHQSGGRIKLPSIEQELKKALPETHQAVTRYPSKTRFTRQFVGDNDLSTVIQGPEAKEFDAMVKVDGGVVPSKIDIENNTLNENLDLLERGKAVTISGYKFTYHEFLNALLSSGLNPDEATTPENLKIMYIYKLNPELRTPYTVVADGESTFNVNLRRVP